MRLLVFLSITCLIISCGQQGSGSRETADEPSPYGTFARGSDSLWVKEYESPVAQQIDFQFYATNDQVSSNLADYAELNESTEEQDVYVFKDSSEVTYADLKLTFSYNTGTWTVEDVAYKEGRTPNMDFSGEWVRVGE